MSKTAMRDYLASKVDKYSNYAGETFTKSTTNYDPQYGAHGFASQAAQNAAFADVLTAATSDSPGEFVDYALNPTGTVSNPLIDFAMPDCWGLTISACEAAITDVADAVGQTVSFNVTTAPSENLNVARNLVLSTFPAASSMVRPDEVAITENPSNASEEECSSTTDNPHFSTGGNTVVAKGNILCNFTGLANYEMTLWGHVPSSGVRG